MSEIQSSIIPMPGYNSMLRNPKLVYAQGETVFCLATDGKLWKCHRRQKGSEGYPIMFEYTPKHDKYEEYMALVQKEDSIHVTTQFMDDDEWAPRQDLDLMPPRMLKQIVEALIENNHLVKSEGDARAFMTTMSKRDLLDTWLNWVGIQGFTDDIIAAYDGLDKAKRGF